MAAACHSVPRRACGRQLACACSEVSDLLSLLAPSHQSPPVSHEEGPSLPLERAMLAGDIGVLTDLDQHFVSLRAAGTLCSGSSPVVLLRWPWQ